MHFVVETKEPGVQIDLVLLETVEEEQEEEDLLGRLPIVGIEPFAAAANN